MRVAIPGRRGWGRARWRSVGVALVAVVALARPAAGVQDVTAIVERRGPLVHEAEPGSSVAVPFRVLNRTSQPIRASTRGELPAGWYFNAGLGEIELAGHEGALRIASVGFPPATAAGDYTIRFFAGAADAPPARWAVDSVVIRVLARPAIELSVLEMPALAVAGEAYAVRALVRNDGNVRLAVRLAGRSSGRHAVALSVDRDTLEPGTASEIVAVVTTRSGITVPRREVLHLEATSESAASPARSEATTGLDLLPSPSDLEPDYHRVPLQATVMASPSGDRGPPIRIAGGGPLFDDGSGRLDVLLQGPGVDGTRLGERDEYRIRYRGERIQLQLGDGAYRENPLSGYGQYGFGAGGTVFMGPLVAGGHHVYDRRFGRRSQSAARLGLVGGRSAVSVDYTMREGAGAGRLWTARADLRPHEVLGLDLAYGRGLGDASSSAGYAAGMQARHRRLDYSVRYLSADPEFPGQNPGMEQATFRGAAHPLEWLTIRVDANRSRWSPLAGTAGTLGAREVWTAGVGIGIGRWIGLELRRTDRRARASPDAAESAEGDALLDDRSAELVRLRVGAAGDAWTVRPVLEVGRSLDQRTGFETGFHRLGVDATLRGWNAISASVGAESFSGSPFHPRPTASGFRLRAGITGDVTATTRIRLSYAATHLFVGGTGGYRFIDATATRKFLGGHELSGRVRRAAFSGGLGEAEPAIRLSYSVPVAVPATRSRRAGRVSVRVYDAETGEGLPGVRVHVGNAYGITDRRGRARLGGLTPGRYTVRIDRRSLGLDRVPDATAALEVAVRPGREATIEIRAVRSARVSGEIRLFAPAAGARPGDPDVELVDAGGFRDAVVELAGRGEVRRQTTGPDGRFTFGDLPAGRWTLTVRARLPTWHRLEADRWELELTPGGEATRLVRVLPVRRGIRLIEPPSVGPPGG